MIKELEKEAKKKTRDKEPKRSASDVENIFLRLPIRNQEQPDS
jgi:hypothetical protein